MDILVVCFSLGGVMKGFFESTVSCLIKDNNVYVISNEGVEVRNIGIKKHLSVPFRRNRFGDFINISSYLKIRKFVGLIHYDVVFFINQHPVNEFVYLLVDYDKTVTYVHDVFPHSGIRWYSLSSVATFLSSGWYKHSKKIIVSYEGALRKLEEDSKYLDKSKFEVVFLGMLGNMMYNIGVDTQDIDVLFFGRVEYYKGLDILVSCMASLPDVKFAIIGRGSMETIYGIRHLPDNCLRVDNYVPDEELAYYIKRSKIIVLPYRDATGTQTIQIAYYYSRPVIVTNVGCFPEYVTHGEDGIIVPPCDVDSLVSAMRDLLADSITREEMGEKGRRKVNTIFSDRVIYEKYMRIFRSLSGDNEGQIC